ncbi:hypothetical protein CWE09_13045 [Aliidiomarina minuta]|uniref:Uncharacterized protein n=1 Tax=Aliidiomarina minuta TaxID=880057 RepID=A0A432W3X2_9GAMM|nr:hypothetical protein [Aliidiomarina minuta]RUO24064.1 hypothetical protein CWE09_13045 [Aliidiomarina minuta]
MAKLWRTLCLSIGLISFLQACTPSAEHVSRHERAESRIQAAAISHDGQFSLLASSEHGLLLYSADNQLIHNWQQDDQGIAQIRAVDISADNQVAVAASGETLALWNTTSGEVMGYWRNDESRIRDIAVSNQGRVIALGRGDGVIVVFEPISGRRIEFFGHSERINSIDISPNGRYVLSGADDHKSILWDTQSGQVIHEFPAEARITQVRLNPDGSQAFTATGQQADIWDLTSGQLVTSLQHHNRYKVFISAAFSGDGQYIVTGSPSRHVEIWRTTDGKRLAATQVSGREGDYPPRAAVIAVAFIGQSGHIITENSAGFGERWQLGTLFEP